MKLVNIADERAKYKWQLYDLYGGRGFERSFAHRTGDQAFSGAVADGSGRKGCQNLPV